MSAKRRDRTDLLNVWNDLVGMWTSESLDLCESAQDATRPARDSYTHERPLISARLDVYADDLIEVNSLDDSTPIYLRPTLRP
jgi:hypothetical protein